MNKTFLISLFQKRYVNHKLILLIDLIIGLFASSLAVCLKLYILPSDHSCFNHIGLVFVLPLISTLTATLIFNSHKQIFRYSSLRLAFKLVTSSVLNAVLLAVLFLVSASIFSIDYTARGVLLYFILFLLIFLLVEMAFKAVLLYLSKWISYYWDGTYKRRTKVLIYGVRDISASLAHQLDRSRDFSVVGFCTRYNEDDAYEIDGKKIYRIHNREDLSRIVKRKQVEGVIFPAAKDFLRERESFINDCESIGLKTLLAPRINLSNPHAIAREGVRRIRIEDLLLRDTISYEETLVHEMYRGKVVLVTGAAGSIGSELVKQIATLDVKQLIILDNAETPLHNLRLYLQDNFPKLNFVPIIADVRRPQRMEMIFDAYKPNIVLHAAAYKHVPLMEEHPSESIQVNIIGTKIIADLCVQFDVEKMVMISTDKAVNPTNVMGACKRSAEIYVQALGSAIENGVIEGKTVFVTTRFGNVLGSQGSVIHLFKDQIAKGGPVTVTHPDIERYFMSIPEACSLVLQASEMATATQIVVFDMGEKHKIVDLAERMIKLAGLKPYEDINIEFTGLRPGEKLYEEVLADEENTIPTKLPKVKLALVRPMELKEIQSIYEQLNELSLSVVSMTECVRLIKDLVPEYKSTNSEYEELDQ